MIKASDLLDTVLKLGEKHPDRQRSCFYFNDNGKACCIVGKALKKHGVDVQAFLEDEDLNCFTSVRELFDYHDSELGLVDDLSDDDMNRLQSIQSAQDTGSNWGRAIILKAR